MAQETVVIKVLRCDNHLLFTLNGLQIWDSGVIEEDPVLNDEIDISAKLNPHPYVNKLHIEGHNAHYAVDEDTIRQNNPAHFYYQIRRNGQLFADVLWGPSDQPPDTRVFTQDHDIVLGEKFAVLEEKKAEQIGSPG